MPRPTTTGNTLVAVAVWNVPTGTLAGPPTGYAFTQLDAVIGLTINQVTFVAQNIVGSNVPIVLTYVGVGNTTSCMVWVWEVRGVVRPVCLDGHNIFTDPASNGGTLPTAPLTTTQPGIVLLMASETDVANFTGGPGYTVDGLLLRGDPANPDRGYQAGAFHRLTTAPLAAEVQFFKTDNHQLGYTVSLVALASDGTLPPKSASNLFRLFTLLGESMPVFNKHVPVVPDNVIDFPYGKGQSPSPVPCSALYVGVGGDVAAVDQDNVPVVFAAVPSGTYLPGRFRRVNFTGTSASNILACYIN